jgi:hypothetical protein
VITADATAELRSDVCDRVAERVSGAHFRRFGEAWLSSIGVDASLFRGEDVDLDRWFALGLNVVDLGPTGAATMRTVFEHITRAATFVIARDATLATYAPNMGEQLDRIAKELVDPGVIAWEDTAEMCCISGAYLARDIAAQCAALGSSIDAYLVDRPDRLLRNRPPGERARRLAAAFEALEREVEARAIGCYGVALDARSEITVEHAFAAAHSIAGDRHHLRVVELPASFGALAESHGFDAIAAAKHAADLGGHVITFASELRAVGNLPAHLRNELPGCDSDEMRLVQLCRSAPGVGTTFVAARDGMDLEEAGRLARLPPMGEAARYLLED